MKDGDLMDKLTTDDLIWIIGQKEVALRLVTIQAQALITENERLRAEAEMLKAPTVEVVG